MSRPSGIFDAPINVYDGTEDQPAANCAPEPLGLIDKLTSDGALDRGVDETQRTQYSEQRCGRCSRMRRAASEED
jgi:hypothetical protein